MKIILSIVILALSYSAAAGYVAGSKINDCNRVDYSSPSFCVQAEGEECYPVPESSGQCGVYKLQDTYGGPKIDVTDCSGQEACQAALAEKVCKEDHVAFINDNYSEVYCIAITGKEMVIDSSLKSSKDAEKSLHDEEEAKIQAVLKLMECGKRGIAKISTLNDGRGLNLADRSVLAKAQLAAYEPIKNLLDVGAVAVAIATIQATEADGEIIRESDKQAVINTLQACSK
jgi:hypothetical protein